VRKEKDFLINQCWHKYILVLVYWYTNLS